MCASVKAISVRGAKSVSVRVSGCVVVFVAAAQRSMSTGVKVVSVSVSAIVSSLSAQAMSVGVAGRNHSENG